MDKIECKALMYQDYFVEVELLSKGMYATPGPPKLYPGGTTMDDLVERAKAANAAFGVDIVSDAYISNLLKCRLVKLVIAPAESETIKS